MFKRIWIPVLVGILVLISIQNVGATKYNDVIIYPRGTEVSDWLPDYEGAEVEVTVTSDIPVNVYIFSADDDWSSSSAEFSEARVSKIGITSTKFTYTLPDDNDYELVIYNPNDEIATVDYEYVDKTAESAGWMLIGICILGVIVGVVILIVIIYFATSKKKKKMAPIPPPQTEYTQEPPPPPPRHHREPPPPPPRPHREPPPPPPRPRRPRE